MYSTLRAVTVNDASILLICFRTYVLPHLDFASQFWNPDIKREITLLESVQRKFTKIVFQRCRLSANSSIPSYHERLSILGLQPLECRRAESDLSMARSIIHGECLLSRSDFFTFEPTQARRHRYGLKQEMTKVAARERSFAVRVAKIYDKLPSTVLSAQNSKQFKRQLSVSKFLQFSQ